MTNRPSSLSKNAVLRFIEIFELVEQLPQRLFCNRTLTFATATPLLSATSRTSLSIEGVRLQKSLWGSCSANSNISMNLRTAFLDKELGLFVIDHELAHLSFHNHSADFYRLLEQRQPESKRLNAELKKAGGAIPLWIN